MDAHPAGLCSTVLSTDALLDGIAHVLEPFALIVCSAHPPLRPPSA
jgi:hypothetical protein